MNSVVRLLFHEVAELTRSEREKLFAERQIAPDLRAEIESLLSFDSTNDHGLTESVANATEEVLKSDNVESLHWGPISASSGSRHRRDGNRLFGRAHGWRDSAAGGRQGPSRRHRTPSLARSFSQRAP